MLTGPELVKKNLIVKAYSGSISYGTNLPTSDVDFRGIFCSDPVNILTPFYPINEVSDGSEEDTKYFELSHFMKMCINCNPNVVELLWADESDIVTSSAAYRMLRDARYELMSSKIAFTTSGYAIAQLKRIKGHNKWLSRMDIGLKDLSNMYHAKLINRSWVVANVSDEFVDSILKSEPSQSSSIPSLTNDAKLLLNTPPDQKDFVSMVRNFTSAKILPREFKLPLHDHRLVSYGSSVFGVVESAGDTTYNEFSGELNINFKDTKQHTTPPLYLIKLNTEECRSAREQYKNFRDWRDNRNEHRSNLELENGYDTKHAMHLVRLLRMGEEVLRTGELLVKRPDAEELLDIRAGAWKYDDLLAYADNMDEKIRGDLYKNTKLKKTVDLKFAAQLTMDIQQEIWNK